MASEDENRLGKYLLKSRLGHGGMGVVYLATDTRLKRDVAVKVLPKKLSSDAVAVRRFLREARVAARLSHPNVVAVHDVDEQKGHCFLVMELVTGGTAQKLIESGPLPWQEATRIIADSCRGLAAAHDAGMIHRDLKPSNIMRTNDGIVKLADFGLAKLVDDSTGATPLTRAGTIMGTPHYMSPEQCQGEQLDARSDLYSMGATYFALLTGQPPFSDPQPLQVMFAHCSKPVPDPRTLKAEIPAACAAVVMKALAKNRTERFSSANEMLAAVNEMLDGPATAAISPSRSFTANEATAIMASSAALPGTMIIDRREHRRKMAVWLGGCSLLLLTSWSTWHWFIDSKPSGNSNQPAGPKQSGGAGGLKAGVAASPITLRLETELPGIETEIRMVAFSPDNQSLFSASLDGAVRQWSIAERRVVRTFGGTTDGIRALAINSSWVIAGGEAEVVWLWGMQSLTPKLALSEFKSATGENWINAIAISPDGRRLAVGSYGALRLYELDGSGARLLKLIGTSTSGSVLCYMIHSVAFSSDSRWLAATTWSDKTVAVWNAETGTLHEARKDLGEQLVTVAFFLNQDRLLFGAQEEGVFSWNLADPRVAEIAPGRSKPVRSLAITPDGAWAIAVGEWGGPIRIHDLQGGKPPQIVNKATHTAALTVAISPDGRQVATGGGAQHDKRGYIHIWNIVPDTAERPE
ncbi:MAG: protein kinase [Planctomycetales bacterium]|nr:protein kinase [Planctomycetales bacterium]